MRGLVEDRTTSPLMFRLPMRAEPLLTVAPTKVEFVNETNGVDALNENVN